MTVLAQTFLPLVRSHLMTLMLLSVRHSCKFNGLTLSLDPVRPYFTFAAKLLAGLNAGMSCAGIVIVVFFEILRATFVARFLTMKLPKPRRYTLFFFSRDPLMLYMKASTMACTCTFSAPVLLAISFTISAFVIVVKN